jgi:serine kinase of HPr protein (carbohydrate metabolism regulator)
MSPSAGASLHANVVVAGEAGILIRGPSGAGKSHLSIALIDEAEARGLYGALVADDRTHLSAEHGWLVARGAPGFEGLIEQRGEGLIRLKYEPAAVVRLVVDLAPRGAFATRWPEEEARTCETLGVDLPRLALDLSLGAVHAARLTLRKLAFDSPNNVRQLVISLDQHAALHKNVSQA